MEKMTREQMIAEFGEPGVENPAIVDLIEMDTASGRVVMVMTERRGWNAGPQQFRQIEEKINRYMGYVLDGHMATHYPQYRGRRVAIRLDCVEAPHGESARFVDAAGQAIRAHDLDFVVNIVPAP